MKPQSILVEADYLSHPNDNKKTKKQNTSNSIEIVNYYEPYPSISVFQ